MYDDDLFSLYNSFNTTTTTDEDEEQSVSSYNPSSYGSTTTSYNPYSTDTGYQDDYSVTPNYEEQSSYESASRNEEQAVSQQSTFVKMQAPMIQQEEKAVVLTKTKQKIYLQARMKIVLAMFVTIVCALMFVSVYNFACVGRINASIADKQIEIEDLKASISALQNTYNEVSDEGNLMDKATTPTAEGGLGFVETSPVSLEVGEIYTEPVIEDLPSNWFNDVCDFLSGLFAA
jgi:cell division protein FtsL